MKVVVFDLDDTLYKEIDFVHSAFHHIDAYLRDKCDIPHSYSIFVEAQSENRNPFDALLEEIYPQDIDIPTLVSKYRNHIPTISLQSDTIEVLNKLSGKVILGLITDGRSITQRNKIEALGLDKYFDDSNIIISEEFGSDKTDKRNYEYFKNLYPDAEKFYYIGDNPNKDFLNPNILGWETICLKDNGENIHSQEGDFPNNFQANIMINNIKDVVKKIN